MELGKHILPDHMVDILQEQGYFSLSQVNYHINSNPHSQVWYQAEWFGFQHGDTDLWDSYINSLQTNHIRLTNKEDTIVWSRNPNCGLYNPKLGYCLL